MFDNITEDIKKRMRYLEEKNERQRKERTPGSERLRQIPPETGKFLAMLASNCPQGNFIEIGTSAGYSTMWISLACRERDIKVKTYEILPQKVKLAKETFKLAGIENYVELYEGDVLEYLEDVKDISFCFLDAAKDVYEQCYDIIIPNMKRHGILVADNAISHQDILKPMLEKAINDDRVDSLIVPIGNGELVCRKYS